MNRIERVALLRIQVAAAVEDCRIHLAEPAADRRRSRAAGGREEDEAHAPVDGEDRAPVVEPDEAIHRALREQESTKSRATVIARDTGGQYQADASTWAREGDRAFDKQLI